MDCHPRAAGASNRPPIWRSEEHMSRLALDNGSIASAAIGKKYDSLKFYCPD
jgi:hypothetical protein